MHGLLCGLHLGLLFLSDELESARANLGCSEEDFREVLNGTHGDDGRRRFVQLEGEMLLATENAKLYRQYKDITWRQNLAVGVTARDRGGLKNVDLDKPHECRGQHTF